MLDLLCVTNLRGPGMTDEINTEIFYTAQRMLRSGRSNRKLKGKTFEGVVTTAFKPACLVNFSGIKFHVILETDKGKSQVEFIVKQINLDEFNPENYRWGSMRDNILIALEHILEELEREPKYDWKTHMREPEYRQ